MSTRLAVRSPQIGPRDGWRLEIGGERARFDRFVAVQPGPSAVTLKTRLKLPEAAGQATIRFAVNVPRGRTTTVALSVTPLDRSRRSR